MFKQEVLDFKAVLKREVPTVSDTTKVTNWQADFWGITAVLTHFPLNATKIHCMNSMAQPDLQLDISKGRKRKLDELGKDEASSLRSAKQICHRASIQLEELLRKLQWRYQLSITSTELLGLCAYLQAILTLTRHDSFLNFDAFIASYPRYLLQLPQFEKQQSETRNLCIPSYHEWFDENCPAHNIQKDPVLDRRVLQSLAQEHPYTFLLLKHRLKFIARQRLQDECYR